MLYALAPDGRHHRAQPGAVGLCPGCNETLIPKCGLINIHHWAHHAGDCDPWYEPETAWHLDWKRRVRPEACEVVMGEHRADIVGNDGMVIELQASPILLPEARAREQFYRRMVWVLDARVFAENLDFRDRGQYVSFRWKHPRKTWTRLVRPRFFDFGDGTMFEARRIHQQVPCGGWGLWTSREQFIADYLSTVILEPQGTKHR